MCRLMTPQLKEALKGYPFYSQDGRGKGSRLHGYLRTRLGAVVRT